LDLQRGWFSHELSEILHELSKLREAGHDPLMYTSNPTFGEYIDDEGEDKDTTNEESGRKDALMRRIRCVQIFFFKKSVYLLHYCGTLVLFF
jgi:hypothetical protein